MCSACMQASETEVSESLAAAARCHCHCHCHCHSQCRCFQFLAEGMRCLSVCACCVAPLCSVHCAHLFRKVVSTSEVKSGGVRRHARNSTRQGPRWSVRSGPSSSTHALMGEPSGRRRSWREGVGRREGGGRQGGREKRRG